MGPHTTARPHQAVVAPRAHCPRCLCVLFLDEFECVEHLGGEVLLRRMRAIG